MKREYLSVSQVASRLGISRAAVYSAIRERRLDSEVVLGKIAVTRRSLASYKPDQDRIRAGKIRLAPSQYVVIDVPKTVQRRLGEELLNLEAFSSAYYTLTGPRTISLKFTDGTRREYQGEACDLVMSVLSERTNIIEIARESGAELFSAQNVRNVAFSHKTSREESFLLVESLADESPISVRGSEAEAVWEQLRRILKPSILATKPRQSTARTGTED